MSQFQSLYRRFRPQRFSEVRGQDHVIRALQNAVRTEQVGHAYLFSGPRGTGKTSSARILAKALNCLNPQDGEPCCECESCLAVQQGSSLDVHELDAASNNGVEAMRDLVSRASLGTPGRWKVYIIDEVHMLSTSASNALLKTLEEPPSHVVFVLATTDPQKVLPTIRSRTQHFEFRLLPGDVLADLLQDVRSSAHIDVADDALDFVIRRGNGSARDALSLLDQVAASGSAHDTRESLEDIINGLIDNDTPAVLTAVAESIHSGSDARRLANDIVDHLRNTFLATMSKGLVPLPDETIEHLIEQANQIGIPRIVRTMEVVGQALIDMRDTVDPRLTLELALIRVTTPEQSTPVATPTPATTVPSASASRGSVIPSASPVPAASTSVATKSPATTPPAATPKKEPKVALGALKGKSAPSLRKESEAEVTRVIVSEVVDPEVGSSAQAILELSLESLTTIWRDSILDSLTQKARARFRVGQFSEITDDVVTCLLPNDFHCDRCEEVRDEVENALTSVFGKKITLKLVAQPIVKTTDAEVIARNAGSVSVPVVSDDHEDIVDVNELKEANDVATSIEAHLKQVFPGAEEVS